VSHRHFRNRKGHQHEHVNEEHCHGKNRIQYPPNCKKLNELEEGQHGKIVSFRNHGSHGHVDESHKELKRHLMSMGFVKGAEIKLEEIAPLGDPLKVKVKGYDIALRKEEAEDIVVDLSEEK
jgi:ferrous iron transport protein A